MKILAIMGSPRKCDSYEAVQLIEAKMKSLGSVEFEYVFLKDAHLEFCTGCCACFVKGENICPLKDDREKIERAMVTADGIIFASPVYVVNVSALMKNFIDRFAYRCHRPRFFSQYALLVTTSAGFGSPQALTALYWAARTWGLNTVDKLGVTGFSLSTSAQRKKTEHRIEHTAVKYYTAVKNKKKVSPGLFNLVIFKFQQAAFLIADKDNADYKYWKDNGWLKKNRYYYVAVKVNFLKRLAASLIYNILRSAMR